MRTFRRRFWTADAPGPSSGAGFTLVEVVVALALTVLLGMVAMVSLMTALHAEQQAGRLREAVLHGLTLESRVRLALPLSDPAEPERPRPAWCMEEEIRPGGEDDPVQHWRILTLHPEDRPALRIPYPFAGPWRETGYPP